MSQMPHNNGDNSGHTRRVQAAQRGHRTRRLNKANAPFDVLGAEVAEVQARVETGELDRNVGRVMLQALALRKDLELAKDRRTEVSLKLEEVDVRSELDWLMDELGYVVNT